MPDASLIEPDAPSFRFFPTTDPLSYFVEYLYVSQIPDHFTARIDATRLPEVEAQLVFAIEAGNVFPGGARLGGGLRACLFVQPAHLQVVPIPGSIRQAIGASLRPAGLRLVVPPGAEALAGAPLFGLDELWGAEGRELRERLVVAGTASARLRLLERYLQARAQRIVRPRRTVQRALALMDVAHGEISTEELARACGCTSRTLRSSTAEETGLAPKHLARIMRIRYALNLLVRGGVPLSDAALTSAFADHAHMSREFRELLGEAPSRLGQKIRAGELPAFSAERNLISTGLLVVPKARGSLEEAS